MFSAFKIFTAESEKTTIFRKSVYCPVHKWNTIDCKS